VENRFWQRLCDRLNVPQYGPLQYDETRRREIIDTLREIFRSKSLDQWESELADLDVCFAAVRNIDEVFRDPFFREREMVVEIAGRNGKPHTALGVPVKLGDTPGAVRTPPVDFGASTADVLRRLGYSADQIRSLSEKGVI